MEIFIKLVSRVRLVSASPIGHLVKDHFRPHLEAHYQSEDQNNRVAALWHRFFLKVRSVFPQSLDPKYTVKRKHSTFEALYADIETNILAKWGPKRTAAHEKLAFACYLFAHTEADGQFLGVARSIDLGYLGKPFEQIFNSPMPLTVDEAQSLLWNLDEQEAEARKAENLVGKNSSEKNTENGKFDIEPAGLTGSLNAKIPYSSKYGLRFKIVEHLPDYRLEQYFGEKAIENVLFLANDSFDEFLGNLAEIVSTRYTASDSDKKAFYDKKNLFLENRAAVRNFLGVDRPIVSEFSEADKLESPLTKRLSHQRLAAAGVSLSDLGRMGAILLSEASELQISEAARSFFVRAIFHCQTRDHADHIAASLRATIPLKIVSLFEFIAVVSNDYRVTPLDDNRVSARTNLYHLAVQCSFEHQGDQFSDDLEVIRDRAEAFFSSTLETVGFTSCAEFSKYLDVQKSLGRPPEWLRYYNALSYNSLFRKRFTNFVLYGDFRSIDALIVLYARSEKIEFDFIYSALSAIYNEYDKLDLSILASIRRRLDILVGMRSSNLPFGEAIDFLTTFVNDYSSTDDEAISMALYLMSYYYFRISNYADARTYCAQSLEHNPKNYAARCFLGLLQFQDGNNDTALRSFRLARRDSGNTYEFAHFYEALVLEEGSDLVAAKEAYIRALLLRPNFYEAAHNLCNCLIAEGRILDASRLAAAQVMKYGALTPEFASALAYGLVSAGYSKEARDMLLRTHQENRAPIIEFNLAVLYFNRSQSSQCLDWLGIIRRNPISPKFIKEKAAELERRISDGKLPSLNQGALLEVQQDGSIDPMLGVLFDKHYSTDIFSQHHLVLSTQRALQRTPRHPTQYMPKSLRRAAEAQLSLEELEARNNQRKSYATALKRGRGGLEPKPVGRRRRNQSEIDHGGFARLLLAPSYSGG